MKDRGGIKRRDKEKAEGVIKSGGAGAGTGKFRNQLKMKTRGHKDHLGDDGWAGLTVGSSGD